MIDLPAIRARDARPEDQYWHVPGSMLKNVSEAYVDRRALLQFVDALAAAARKVTCAECSDSDLYVRAMNRPCPDCAELRALLEQVTP